MTGQSKTLSRKDVYGLDDIEIIYKKYYQYVKGYARSLCLDEVTAEEITQETFYKALNSYNKFNHQCKIETWLCRIAHNVFVNSKRRKPAENIDSIINLVDDSNVEDNVISTDEVKRILSVSTQLQSPYKEVFYMKTLGDFSYKVIAEVFGKTESWARVTYHRAKQQITERMNSNG